MVSKLRLNARLTSHYLTNRVLLSRNYEVIVALRKFDVPRTNIRFSLVGEYELYNNYSMSPSWIWRVWSDKITNERVARVGYNPLISNKGKWNNCFSKFSNRVWPPIFISTIFQSVRKENLTYYFPYDVKLGLLAHSRSFLGNQKARNAIVKLRIY